MQGTKEARLKVTKQSMRESLESGCVVLKRRSTNFFKKPTRCLKGRSMRCYKGGYKLLEMMVRASKKAEYEMLKRRVRASKHLGMRY